MAALLTMFQELSEGFTFFDVGANIGLYSTLCAVLFEPAHVVAFEPTPSTAAMAERVAKANDVEVTVEQCALGDQIGQADLFLSVKSDASNSMVQGFKKATGTIAVPVTTLDEYVERSGLRPDVVKIDVETFEPAVLAGAADTMRQWRPTIIVEVLHRRGHDHGPEIERLVDGLGYTYYRLGPNPSLRPEPSIFGTPHMPYRDWLLTPEPLGPTFEASFRGIQQALVRCTADGKSHVPVAASTAGSMLRVRRARAAVVWLLRWVRHRRQRP